MLALSLDGGRKVVEEGGREQKAEEGGGGNRRLVRRFPPPFPHSSTFPPRTLLQVWCVRPLKALLLLGLPGYTWLSTGGFPGGASGKASACQYRRWSESGKIPRRGNGMALQCSSLKIPRTEEPGGLQSMQRAGHSWVTEHTAWSCRRLARYPPSYALLSAVPKSSRSNKHFISTTFHAGLQQTILYTSVM